jgi:hypothetical protein
MLYENEVTWKQFEIFSYLKIGNNENRIYQSLCGKVKAVLRVNSLF